MKNARSQSEVLRRKNSARGQNFVRSTFDWAVCSEPLASLRRTRAYGYSIVSWRSRSSGECELGPKWVVEILTTGLIVGRMQVSKLE